MTVELRKSLEQFAAERDVCGEGALSVVLVITRQAQSAEYNEIVDTCETDPSLRVKLD